MNSNSFHEINGNLFNNWDNRVIKFERNSAELNNGCISSLTTSFFIIMEKYTKFADDATGINPFLHFAPTYGRNLYNADNKLKLGFFGSILFVMRLPFLVFCLLAWNIFSTIPLPVWLSFIFVWGLSLKFDFLLRCSRFILRLLNNIY